MGTRIAAGAVLVLALGLPMGASAQDADEPADAEAVERPDADAANTDDDRARAHFMLGRAEYDAGNYAAAIEQFGRAFSLSERPSLLFNLYQAHHRAGNLAPAIEYLERYLNEGEVEDLERGTLNERLTNLREQRAAEVAEEERLAAEAEAARLAELARVREEAGTSPKWTAGVVILSIGGAAAAAFGLFAGLAVKEDGDLADGCGVNDLCTSGDLGRLQTLTRAADVSIALAGASIVTGIILMIVGSGDGDGEEEEETSARFEPLVGPGAAGFSVQGSF